MEQAMPAVPAADYPVRVDVEYPERLSRWKIFVKWLLALPHFIGDEDGAYVAVARKV